MEPAQEPVEEPSDIRLRSYQQEMWEASLQKNIIVAMDTGSGKTHIAIARILTTLETSDADQVVWFMSPSVALSIQQAVVLSTNLPAYHVRTLTGNDGVDKWTDQRLWDAALADVRVVVGTPAVLADALAHGFVKISRLSLLVFDEAHRASKGHPMNAIMQKFYHPARQRGEGVPHVLGLTASPVMSTKKGSLEQIERNLDSITTTPKIHRADLEAFVRPPEFELIVYQDAQVDALVTGEAMCRALYQAVRSYDFGTDPFVLDLGRQDDSRSRKELTKVLLKRKTYTSEQLRALDLRACNIASQLGPSVAKWYISTCITKFRDGTRSMSDTTAFMPDLSVSERTHLNRIFDSIENDARQSDSMIAAACYGITDKAEKLIQVLTRAGASVRGIVFVEQRVQVTALAYLLNQLPEITRTYRIATFVGTSASTSRKVSVADLVAIKQQQHGLDEFRTGEKNLMLATNVLEEGIDIPACNFVVCFDAPKNLVSFVQRRGRARQKDSKYFLFASQDDLRKNNKDWASLETQMKQAYMDENRQVADNIGDEQLDDLSYRVASTGALLTSENAKSHLYHFCSVGTSQVSNYIDSRPEFDTDEIVGTKQWTASVDLPPFVHPDLRHATSSQARCPEQAAIKDAAFQAYVALHKAGLVNDNLLPLIQDYGPDAGQQHLDQPSLIQVSERESSWKHLGHNLDPTNARWSHYSISVSLRDERVVQTGMWAPYEIPIIESFRLYWNEYDVYRVAIKPCAVNVGPLGDTEHSLLVRCTDLLLRLVHASRMKSAPIDLPVLSSPVDIESSENWLRSCSGSHSASVATIENRSPLDSGLVSVNGQIGRSYFLQGIQTSQNEEGVQVEEAVMNSFPRRRDFLHPVPESNMAPAYTSKHAFPLADCTVSNMPAKYAILSAFLPSILHRIDIAFVVSRLQYNQLLPVSIEDPSLVLEAISSPSSGEKADYNRLEFLGDTILKHSTELQVISQHTNWPEAYLTLERNRIVRNDNLAQAALKAGLDEFILTKPFTGSKWRPPSIQELLQTESATREMSTKTLADVVESLIGAAYVDGGLSKALKCISTLLPTETWNPPSHCFDLLIEDLRPTKYIDPPLLERLVGHKFQHPTLLVEAITHVSFPFNRTGLSYERLEFLGDSVLDMIVTPKLFAHLRKLKHWELHRIHSALVNSYILGFFCMQYAIEEEITDVKQDESKQYVAQKSTRQAHLHDFLRAAHMLLPMRQKALKTFSKLQETIADALEHSKEYPWPELISLNVPKLFSDMIESVLGALFIDTRGDLAVCEAFVERLGILKVMRRILDENVECINPKERLGMVADREAVRYVNSKCEDGTLQCVVKVGEEEVAVVGGCGSKEEAEAKAAHQACKILEGRSGYGERAKQRKLDVITIDGEMDVDE